MRELSVSDYCCEKCGDVNQGTVYDTNVSDLRLCQSCYAALCEGKQFPYPWRYWFVKCEPPHCGCPVEEIQVEEVEHIDADPLASKRLRASNRAKNAVWNDCPTVEAVVSITGERKVCQCGEIF